MTTKDTAQRTAPKPKAKQSARTTTPAKPKTSKATITWTPIKVRLKDLRPWESNPRQTTKKQAERILKSFKRFGQVQTIAVSPSLKVLDGHQRLSALKALHGPDYEIDARQSSRELTEVEHQALVVLLHTGATGSYDFDLLSTFDPALLQENGFDQDLLAQLNLEQAALLEILGQKTPDPREMWEGMPEFEQEDAASFRRIVVHFDSQGDVDDFAKRIGQKLTPKTVTIWHPYKAPLDLKQYEVQDES